LGTRTNCRERFLTALDLREPDCVPVTDLGLDAPIVEAVLRKETGLGQAEQFTRASSITGAGESWKSTIDNRAAMIKACMKLGFDAIPAMVDYSAVTKAYRPRFVGNGRYIDQWGRIMQPSVEAKTTYFVGGTIQTLEDLDKYEPPDAFHPDIFEMIRTVFKPIKTQDVVVMGLCHSGWHMAFQVRGGIDKMALDLHINPVFARKVLDKISKSCQGFAEAFIEAGADVLFVTDDYADNHGPFMSPKLFREYELPNLMKIIEIGRKHGVPVLKHTDGNVYPILDDIVNSGIRGLHPIEPDAMDLGDVKARYGNKICLLGNVDCRYVLPFGNEQDVRRDVRRCIDTAAKGGGFVLTSSNSIHANVIPENVYAMMDEARRYGKYR